MPQALAFRRLWLANLFSLLGSQVSRIGLILLIVQRTNSVRALALLVCLETLPAVIVAPFAGAVVDRTRRRRVLIAADLVRFAALMGILIQPTVVMICVMAAVQSVASAFFQPARAALVPMIVPQDRLVVANSWDQGAANVMFIVGPIVGTELMLLSGVSWTLILDGVTFLASAAVVATMPLSEPYGAGAARPAVSALEDIRSGWRYLRDHAIAGHMSGLFFMSLLCTGLWMPLAPFFIRDHLGGGSRVLAWQFAAFGAGAVAGSFLAPTLIRRFGRGVVVCAGLIAEGGCQTAYAIATGVGLSTALIFLWGVVVSLIVVPFYSILQTVVEERFLGRVFSTVRQSENLALMFALLLAMLLQERMDSHGILLVGGVAYCGLAAVSCLTGGGRTLLATR